MRRMPAPGGRQANLSRCDHDETAGAGSRKKNAPSGHGGVRDDIRAGCECHSMTMPGTSSRSPLETAFACMSRRAEKAR
ncbi:hypothetical protein BTRA_4834 [Burkholderia thailandensis USAMRU Malaysia |nr:hypothetical protein BTQ_5444 [Burkholderia thailandensis 2002721723]AHI82193.1 hypothetical protein BTJ_4100 [Burkholderia thailandensis E444]AIC89364.1 hypothetical protein BTRA_4834 [Burkholderia thailandensis USAMRU Malaysia \